MGSQENVCMVAADSQVLIEQIDVGINHASTTVSEPRETQVPGLFLALNAMSEDDEKTLMTAIDEQAWGHNRLQTRRVQMYGVRHNEQYRIHAKAPVTPLPSFAFPLIDDLHNLVA